MVDAGIEVANVLATNGPWLIAIAAAFGFLMAWGIGANDVANAMGTSVGSNAITIKQAIIIAMIFEFAGAFLAGGEVTSTIRNGIIDSSYFTQTPELLVYGMIGSLLAAAELPNTSTDFFCVLITAIVVGVWILLYTVTKFFASGAK